MDGCVSDFGKKQLEMVVRLNSGVRLLQSSCEQDWVVEHVLFRRSYKLGVAGMVLVLLASYEQTVDQLANGVAERFGVDPARVIVLINRLLEEGVLVRVQDAAESLESQEQLPESQEQRSAWYHHHGTFDYPFTYYDEHFVSQTDRELMSRYYNAKPDDFRCKKLRSGEIDLAGDRSSVRGLDLGPTRGRFNSAQQEVPLLQLLWLLTAKIGKLGTRSEFSEPVVLRTSPSGGSRHPTETYIGYAKGHQFKTPSLYHCQIDPAGLVSIPMPEGSYASSWADFGDSLSLDDYDEVFYILFTTMFERNMYRYREPRTFRTIFMDVGHLVMTAARVFENCGYRFSVSLALNHGHIQECFGFKRLEESGIAVVRVCGGKRK